MRLFSFYVNGASFLAFAAVAAKRGLETRLRGTEIELFHRPRGLPIVLVHAWFPIIVYGFAGLTLMTAITRITLAWWVFDLYTLRPTEL